MNHVISDGARIEVQRRSRNLVNLMIEVLLPVVSEQNDGAS